jgi:hypothetical protein
LVFPGLEIRLILFVSFSINLHWKTGVSGIALGGENAWRHCGRERFQWRIPRVAQWHSGPAPSANTIAWLGQCTAALGAELGSRYNRKERPGDFECQLLQKSQERARWAKQRLEKDPVRRIYERVASVVATPDGFQHSMRFQPNLYYMSMQTLRAFHS